MKENDPDVSVGVCVTKFPLAVLLTEQVGVTVAAALAFARFAPTPQTGWFRNRDNVKIRVANAELATL
ncbi:hypothetical protein L596_006282 [Steinernema carpocapsae]|uniref:Uncharacterized protein n=1 Tax=Steinernema carpocapsae TaxID=34508 RepID=A0A4U8V3H4_STECR|nr:hypothetical protein L596_006282 [Steinernema carpocapsae]